MNCAYEDCQEVALNLEKGIEFKFKRLDGTERITRYCKEHQHELLNVMDSEFV